MPKKIINKEDTSPWSTSSQEIGRHIESKAKQEVRGGEVNKDTRAFEKKQSPLSQARPSTATKRPEDSSFARFVNGESGRSWSHSENLTFRDQAYLSRDNPVGTSAVFDKRKDQYNSARKADAETSRQPSTSVKGKGATTPFFAAGNHAFHNGGKHR